MSSYERGLTAPDHIQAHRVAWRAFQLAGDPGVSVPGGAGQPWVPAPPRPGTLATPWPVTKLYATAMPRSVLATAIDLSGRDGVAAPASFIAEADADTLPFGAADDQLTTEIDGTGYLAAKPAAMRAHATQIIVDEPSSRCPTGYASASWPARATRCWPAPGGLGRTAANPTSSPGGLAPAARV